MAAQPGYGMQSAAVLEFRTDQCRQEPSGQYEPGGVGRLVGVPRRFAGHALGPRLNSLALQGQQDGAPGPGAPAADLEVLSKL